MKTIDARGQLCPKPLIMLRTVMRELNESSDLQILIDNEISRDNLMKFLSDQNIEVKCETAENHWIISGFYQPGQQSFQPTPSVFLDSIDTDTNMIASLFPSDYVVVIKNDKMGQGDSDLGSILIQGYFSALAETENKPVKVIFYNAGVMLTTDNSPVLHSLKKMSELNVDLVVCGACVDFYQIKSDVAVGRISNMMEIVDILSRYSSYDV
jgi:selenium metabolism protein YedF